MSFPPNDKSDEVKLSARPEGQAVLPEQIPLPGFPQQVASQLNVTVGAGPSQLAVPPELLTKLGPEQISQVLNIKHAQVKNENLANWQHTGLVAIAMLVVAAVLIMAARAGQYEWIEKIVIPIATGIGGYIAGRGHERMKRH